MITILLALLYDKKGVFAEYGYMQVTNAGTKDEPAKRLQVRCLVYCQFKEMSC